MTEQRTRFPVGLTIAVLICLSILIGLGVWQLERRAWKRDLLTRIEAAQAATPRPLGEVLRSGEDADFVRVIAECPGLHMAPFQEVYALAEGKMGSRLVSPCRLTGEPYDSVLVDRGFVDEAISSRPPEADDMTPVRIEGVLRAVGERAGRPKQGRLWHGRDLAGLAAALGLERPAPYFLMAETSSNPEWLALKPSPLPTGVSNRHLEYALTWFGLAAALAGVYAAMLLRRRRGQ